MAIRVPGYRTVHGRLSNTVKKNKRKIVAVLSLTAMVDLFTVLTIFLLQNYNQTGVALEVPKQVVLPQAKMSEELQPANVVTITDTEILIDGHSIIKLDGLKEDNKWLIEPLRKEVEMAFLRAKESLPKAAKEIKEDGKKALLNELYKVTVQADQDVEFAIIKRVMFTVTEAGASEINFAVLKKSEKS